MIQVKPERESNAVVLELSGALDGRAVDELINTVLRQPPSCALVIDLSRASEVYDSALGRLEDALPRRGNQIRAILGRHLRVRPVFFCTPDHDGIHAHTD